MASNPKDFKNKVEINTMEKANSSNRIQRQNFKSHSEKNGSTGNKNTPGNNRTKEQPELAQNLFSGHITPNNFAQPLSVHDSTLTVTIASKNEKRSVKLPNKQNENQSDIKTYERNALDLEDNDNNSELLQMSKTVEGTKRKRQRKTRKKNRNVNQLDSIALETDADLLNLNKEDSDDYVVFSENATDDREETSTNISATMKSTSTTINKGTSVLASSNERELELGLRQAEQRLEKDYIYPLQKKSVAFPEAKYFCRVCSHHLNTIHTAHHHIKDKRHKRECKQKHQDDLLMALIDPPTPALDALDSYLHSVLSKKVLKLEDIKVRKSVVKNLNKTIMSKIPGCSATLYGSSQSNFGFMNSDLNIDVEFPEDCRAPVVLLQMLKLLRASDCYKDVHEDFEAKFPRIEFVDKQSGLACKLSAGNLCSVKTSNLLALYAKLNPKVLQVGMLFRIWARFCKLDKQDEGSIPAHSYPIMAVFFLQSLHLLPVLHEKIAEHDLNEILLNGGFCQQFRLKGTVWWYNPTPVPENEIKPNSNKNPLIDNDDVDEFSDIDSDIPNSPVKPKKYFKPLTHAYKPIEIFDTKVADNSPTLAKIWLALLKFYAAEFDIENLVITILTSARVTRSERGWSHKRIAIEDPYSGKWNLCKPLNSQSIFTYFISRLKFSVTYFYTAHIQKKDKNIKTTSTSNGEKMKNLDKFLSTKTDYTSQTCGAVVKDVVNKVCNKYNFEENKSSNETPTEKIYNFTQQVITENKYPIIVCCLCKREGHGKRSCPDDLRYNKLVPLKPMTNTLQKMLTSLCEEMFVKYAPSDAEVSQREFVCNKLLLYLQRMFDPKVQIQLFGSSRNGFTFRGSDLDICMTFMDDKIGKDLDFIKIIEGLSKVLRRNLDLSHIIPITTAKVPIVKFTHKNTNLEGDISLYNLLAQENTKMLMLYSKVDRRCRVIGYMMKAFVKLCCIGDASRGSLSSYAYTLFVIYFLQQRNPPVLPVLQEMYEGEVKPVKKVDGWNAWFYNNIEHLPKVWPDYGKNNESVGALWLGLLRFYTETFDFQRHVVCIRQKELLTSFEKEWTSKYICIEDPFDLSHNLGAGVSRKMTNFIMRVFIKAREHFGKSPKDPKVDLHSYFFDAKLLMDGQEVPNDRCCRVCGKIGHFVKDCPKKRNRKNGEDGVTCFNCNKKGHIKRECPELRKSQPTNGMVQVNIKDSVLPLLEEATKNLTPSSAQLPKPTVNIHANKSQIKTKPNTNQGLKNHIRNRNHSSAPKSLSERRPNSATSAKPNFRSFNSTDRSQQFFYQKPNQSNSEPPKYSGAMDIPSKQHGHSFNHSSKKCGLHHSPRVQQPQIDTQAIQPTQNFVAGMQTVQEVERQMMEKNKSHLDNHGNNHGISDWIGATPPRSLSHHDYRPYDETIDVQSRRNNTAYKNYSPRGIRSDSSMRYHENDKFGIENRNRSVQQQLFNSPPNNYFGRNTMHFHQPAPERRQHNPMPQSPIFSHTFENSKYFNSKKQ